jgi:hypothetical protein
MLNFGGVQPLTILFEFDMCLKHSPTAKREILFIERYIVSLLISKLSTFHYDPREKFHTID